MVHSLSMVLNVVVSQLQSLSGRIPGQSFHTNGTKLYSARIIPFKGSWIEGLLLTSM